MIKIDFSIIIPTYNNLEYLKRAIISIENQTIKNFETIIIVDGSTDDTLKFLQTYDKNKINLNYTFIEPSGGPAKPRNIGIKLSRGKWLCFLDSDDEWYKEKIEQINSVVIENNNLDIIYHKEVMNDKNKLKIINNKSYKNNFYLNLLYNGNICSTSATVVNADFVKKNNIKFLEKKKFVSVEDFGFWLDIAKKGGKFFFLDKVLGVYHINEKSISNNILWHKFNTIKLLFYHVFVLNKNNKEIKKNWRKIILLYKIDILILKILKLKQYSKICEIIILFVKKPFMLITFLKRKLNI